MQGLARTARARLLDEPSTPVWRITWQTTYWRLSMKTGMIAMTALALSLSVSTAIAQGQSISFQLGDVAAKLHDAPCENAKVRELLPPDSGKFHAADVLWQGHMLAACWAIMGNQIVVVDETGDSGVLSPAGFRGGERPV